MDTLKAEIRSGRASGEPVWKDGWKHFFISFLNLMNTNDHFWVFKWYKLCLFIFCLRALASLNTSVKLPGNKIGAWQEAVTFVFNSIMIFLLE